MDLFPAVNSIVNVVSLQYRNLIKHFYDFADILGKLGPGTCGRMIWWSISADADTFVSTSIRQGCSNAQQRVVIDAANESIKKSCWNSRLAVFFYQPINWYLLDQSWTYLNDWVFTVGFKRDCLIKNYRTQKEAASKKGPNDNSVKETSLDAITISDDSTERESADFRFIIEH